MGWEPTTEPDDPWKNTHWNHEVSSYGRTSRFHLPCSLGALVQPPEKNEMGMAAMDVEWVQSGESKIKKVVALNICLK